MDRIVVAILEPDPVPAARLNPDLPPKLEEIIDKALEKDHEQRYQVAAKCGKWRAARRAALRGIMVLALRTRPAGPWEVRTVRYDLGAPWREEAGNDIAEYAVILAVLLVIVVGTLRLIGSNAKNLFLIH